MKNKYYYMLENATNIQYLLNVLEWNENAFLTIYEGTPQIEWDEFDEWGRTFHWSMKIDWKCFKFLVKGRTLRSALGTPMARYYGYKALNRGGVKHG